MTDAITLIRIARDEILFEAAEHEAKAEACRAKVAGLEHALEILGERTPRTPKPASTRAEKPESTPTPQTPPRNDTRKIPAENAETPVQSKTVPEKPMSVSAATNEAGKTDVRFAPVEKKDKPLTSDDERPVPQIPASNDEAKRDMEARLLALHAEGLSSNRIAKTLTEEGMKISCQGVINKLREHGKESNGKKGGVQPGRAAIPPSVIAEPEESEEEPAEDPIPEEEEDEGPFYGKPQGEEAEVEIPTTEPEPEPEPEEGDEEPEDDDGAMAACRELGARCSVREMHGKLLYRLDGAFAPPHEIVKAARQAARSEKLRKATERTA